MERDCELGLASFLERLALLWLIKLINCDDGPAHLHHWHALKSSSDFLLLFRVIEPYSSLSKDLIKLVTISDKLN